uniref:Methyltransferase type 11 domain-containing protein n=1 Tax=Proboscia inermis TaxID=420281 RepID=A0A6T8FIE9_9STRA|mmetsp:Transcript_10791/g.10916  ORF Transcript_10791/g.10916 Transcript_10791/m.10916 type:complete len:130 (+) Transcript_10791:94-483(+)
MDMTILSFQAEEFDVVIDKAAMDAIMTKENDVWNPSQEVVDSAWSMCSHISRVLKRNGQHIQISFAQPHFRNKYLLGQHVPTQNISAGKSTTNQPVICAFHWDCRHETVEGTNSSGCFQNFMYIMQKVL